MSLSVLFHERTLTNSLRNAWRTSRVYASRRAGSTRSMIWCRARLPKSQQPCLLERRAIDQHAWTEAESAAAAAGLAFEDAANREGLRADEQRVADGDDPVA